MTSSVVFFGVILAWRRWNHAETRISFTETQQVLRIAGKTGDQYIQAVSKVCDGLRGYAFVAAQEVGFHRLREDYVNLIGRFPKRQTLCSIVPKLKRTFEDDSAR